MGNAEQACATGIARIASLTAPSLQAAAQTVEQAIAAQPGVKEGKTISEGPGKVGRVDGYRHRFTIVNPATTLTTEVAAMPTGPSSADAQGNHYFSVILVEISTAPGAPKPDVIDSIVGSAQASTGGKPPA
jgi:hypothetical protein